MSPLERSRSFWPISRLAIESIDRVGISLLRDAYSVAVNGLTGFHCRRRVGAGAVKPEARVTRVAAAVALTPLLATVTK
jgi:hypothetical protein